MASSRMSASPSAATALSRNLPPTRPTADVWDLYWAADLDRVMRAIEDPEAGFDVKAGADSDEYVAYEGEFGENESSWRLLNDDQIL